MLFAFGYKYLYYEEYKKMENIIITKTDSN
jgi:hypothetical protein